MASTSDAAEDHTNILREARRLRLGTWIERILRQARKTLTGQGVKAVKDIAEKTITQLPALTGASTYTAWDKAISKLVESVQDGKQLTALAHARAFIDHNIPLPQKYMELPSAEFDISTATMADFSFSSFKIPECSKK